KLYSDISFEVIRRIFNVELSVKKEERIKAKEEFEKEKEDVVLKSAQRINPYSQSPTSEQKKDLTTSPKEPHIHTHEHNHEESPKESDENKGFRLRTPGTATRKIGRNDPCWCGSGKKYKKCHYPN
ncbi:MAG: SEC-C metal-binding domain-containing protein, partial [Patescibacteria group bacterium]